MSAPLNPCVHCKIRTRQPDRRGLCYRCFKEKDIRILYYKSNYGSSKLRYERIGKVVVEEDSEKMTEEELDRLIESRRPTMPKEAGSNSPAREDKPEPYTIPIIRVKYRQNRLPEYG